MARVVGAGKFDISLDEDLPWELDHLARQVNRSADRLRTEKGCPPDVQAGLEDEFRRRTAELDGRLVMSILPGSPATISCSRWR